MIRIGHGYDVHRLVEGRSLILGGVKVDFLKGLMGHSDADVLVHAIIDAILGAAGLGDIGKLFPDQDIRYLNISSLDLLSVVYKKIKGCNYKIGNIDSTIIAQSPKLSVYTYKMSQNIANICEISPQFVSIKATTEEGLGFTGKLEGISAHAVCVISSTCET